MNLAWKRKFAATAIFTADDHISKCSGDFYQMVDRDDVMEGKIFHTSG